MFSNGFEISFHFFNIFTKNFFRTHLLKSSQHLQKRKNIWIMNMSLFLIHIKILFKKNTVKIIDNNRPSDKGALKSILAHTVNDLINWRILNWKPFICTCLIIYLIYSNCKGIPLSNFQNFLLDKVPSIVFFFFSTLFS